MCDGRFIRIGISLGDPSRSGFFLLFSAFGEASSICCNPTLREFKVLPRNTIPIPKGYVCKLEQFGFGFDADTNSYKFVSIVKVWEQPTHYHTFSWEEDSYVRTDLYDSSTNSWRIIDTELPDFVCMPECNLFFNGAQHWMVSDHHVGKILCFDVGREVLKWILHPPSLWDYRHDGKLGMALVTLKQSLAILRYSYESDSEDCIDIWLLKEYGVSESWTKQFVVGPYPTGHDILARCSWQDQWILFESNGQLVAYAIHANQIKTFQFHGHAKSFRAVIFRESCVSLNQVLLI
ncbi:F-box protein [Sesamum alatum]|uniref:F-box protein n=1 Tax=Sesamum alatum TaxID=300844 RepID=A0AAE1YTW3_9LAMI|nr:F-box protein [Sesamum alatum]